MDTYCKVLLTLITFLMGAIAVKLWQPNEYATVGDVMNDREEALSRMPIVRIYGTVDVNGSVDVTELPHIYGTVEVENTVDVTGSVDCY